MWNRALPGRRNPPGKFISEKIRSGKPCEYIDNRSLRINFGVIGHFVERGLKTNHLMMAQDVNHRGLNIDFWTSRSNGRTHHMIESLANGKKEEVSFQLGSENISTNFFTIVDSSVSVPVDRDIPIETPYAVSGYRGDNMAAAGHCVASDRLFNILTPETFRRALAFFNYDWYEDASTPKAVDAKPTLDDITSFVQLFSSDKLCSVKAFSDFVEKYELGEIFEIDKDWDLQTIHYRFGIVLRTLVDMRLNVHDGQHRLFLLIQIMCGFVEPTLLFPLPRNGWSSSLEFRSLEASNTQVYNRMAGNVAMAMTEKPDVEVDGWVGTPEVRLDKVIAKLKNAGAILTASELFGVGMTWEHFIGSIIKKMGDIENHTFDSYWCQENHENFNPSTMESNATTVYNALESVCGNAFATQFFGGEGYSVEAFRNDMSKFRDALIAPKHIAFGRKLVPVAMVNVIRACCHTREQRQRLGQFFGASISLVTQRSSEALVKTHDLRNGRFIQKWVHSKAVAVAEHIRKRIAVEQYFIAILRDTGPTEEDAMTLLKSGMETVKDKITNLTWTSFDWEQDCVETSEVEKLFPLLPSEKQLNSWPHSRINKVFKGAKNPNADGAIVGKMVLAWYQTTVSDIIECCVTEGFDPDMKDIPVGETNSSDETKEIYARIRRQRSEALKELDTEKKAMNWRPASTAAMNMVYIKCDDKGEVAVDGNDTYHVHYELEAKLEKKYDDNAKRVVAINKNQENLRFYLKSKNQGCVNEYQSGGPSKGKNSDNKGPYKLSMKLLIELYLDFIKDRFALRKLQLILLSGLQGDNILDKGSSSTGHGGVSWLQKKNGIPPSDLFTSRFPRIHSFVPEAVRFRTFCRAVLGGTVNAEKDPAFDNFNTFVEVANNESSKKYRVVMNTHAHKERTPPEPISKEEKKRQAKIKMDKDRLSVLIDYYCLQMKTGLLNSLSDTNAAAKVAIFNVLCLSGTMVEPEKQSEKEQTTHAIKWDHEALRVWFSDMFEQNATNTKFTAPPAATDRVAVVEVVNAVNALEDIFPSSLAEYKQALADDKRNGKKRKKKESLCDFGIPDETASPEKNDSPQRVAGSARKTQLHSPPRRHDMVELLPSSSTKKKRKKS